MSYPIDAIEFPTGCHVNHISFTGYAGDLMFSLEGLFRGPNDNGEGSLIYNVERSPFRASKTSKGHLLELEIDDSLITIMILNSTMSNGDQVWYVNKKFLPAEFVSDEEGDLCTIIVNSANSNRIIESILDALKPKRSLRTNSDTDRPAPNLARLLRFQSC